MTLRFSIILVLSVLLCSKATFASAKSVPQGNYSHLLSGVLQHQEYLDTDRHVDFKWSIASSTASNAPDVLVAEISAATRGYIGFGISPTGGMIGADILLMWVDDDTEQAYLQNRFATENAEPKIIGDEKNQPPSIILAYKGSQNATHTTFRFVRLLNATCANRKNFDIESGATRLIFSYNPNDPTPPPDSRAQYHGPKQRGTKTLYLLDDQTGAYERDKQAAKRDANEKLVYTANWFEMPPVETHYQQQFHQLPKFENDVHIIGFEAVREPAANVRFIHHFMVWICDNDFKPPPAHARSTNFSSYHTESWSTTSAYTAQKCMFSTLWAWAVGGTPFAMPHDVGLRLTPRDSGRYILVETHYNNPSLVDGVRDNSGVRISLLQAPRKLRAHDASYFIVGYQYGPEQTVPSGVAAFNIPSVCTPECTSEFVRPEGVRIFSVLLHSQTAGKSIILRHFRRRSASAGGEQNDSENVELELPPIAADRFYDFNYHLWRPVNATLLPGDRLVVECVYETIGRNSTTFGGQPTTEEMCYANMFTTPPIEMNACVSIIQRDEIFRTLGEKESAVEKCAVQQRHYVTNVYAQNYLKGVELYRKRLDHYNWTTSASDGATKLDKLQALYYEQKHTYMCGSSHNVTNFLEGRQKVFAGTAGTNRYASGGKRSTCSRANRTASVDDD